MPISSHNQDLGLEIPVSAGVTVINAKCSIHKTTETISLFVHGAPVFHFSVDDEPAMRLLFAQAVLLDFATASEVARAFGVHVRLVQRAGAAFRAGGASALVPRKPGPTGPRVGVEREAIIAKLRSRGASFRAIGRVVLLDQATVRATVKRLGLKAQAATVAEGARQMELLEVTAQDTALTAPGQLGEFAESVAAQDSRGAEREFAGQNGVEPAADNSSDAIDLPSHPVSAQSPVAPSAAVPAPQVSLAKSMDLDPDDRCIDRMLAHKGLLLDAAPLFKDRDAVPRAGALLVVPLLVTAGLFEAGSEVFGSLGPSFYGLRNSLMWLMFMALLRMKNPESTKQYSPRELGWLLGLDRAPEVKTLHRKLALLGDDAEKCERFLVKLAERRVAGRSEALGYLYFDGHVRVYSGKVDIPKTHIARMRICQPATQDVWVNDAQGSPVLFVTQEAHPQLVSAIEEMLGGVRSLVGEDMRPTIVFDRGGWSPELFKKLNDLRFDVLTYRKGAAEPIESTAFVPYSYPTTSGVQEYLLADQEIQVGSRGFKMRQVTRLKDGHHTHIVTTRRDLSAPEVAWRMFSRWTQENFFKYMRQEFAIDSLVQYASEAADGQRMVGNPARTSVDRQITTMRKEVAKIAAQLGQCTTVQAPDSVQASMNGTLWTQDDLESLLRQGNDRIAQLLEQRKTMAARIPLGEAKPTAQRLVPWRKRLSDGLKMLAYQVETDLVRAIAPHYKRHAEDGHKLIAAALQSAGDIRVSDGELVVTLQPQSSPHRSRAVAAICRTLTETDTKFPGTDLRLRYAVAGQDAT